jgi:hypothetical protein
MAYSIRRSVAFWLRREAVIPSQEAVLKSGASISYRLFRPDILPAASVYAGGQDVRDK